MSTHLSTEERLQLFREIGEEVIDIERLKKLIEDNEPIVAYDGFEPSGRMHLGSAIVRAINVNKAIKAGAKFKMFVADWHAWANHKMSGDLEKIQTVGKYFVEVWKASGMDVENVEFVWASDLVKKDSYWDTVMKIATQVNLPRAIRTLPALGRGEDDSISSSFIFYSIMQVADIFELGVNVTQLGSDQRKSNMLAREVAEGLGYEPPVVISNHLLLGLTPPDEDGIVPKMSKSVPNSAIFVTDTSEEIKDKIMKAWAPEGVIDGNPILELCKYIIFEKEENGITIERPDKFGGNVSFATYNDLESAYDSKELFPLDLKNAVIKYIDSYIAPIRNHFEQDPEAAKLKKLVDSFQVTR